MQNHIISKHPEDVPSGFWQRRFPQTEEANVVDPECCRAFAINRCLKDLLPPHLISGKSGFRQWLDKYIKGLCGEENMTAVIDDVNKDIQKQVSAILQ